ncbi:uncharacterized protein LOC62_01G000690 [Vanrija pseudolonga]|nr:hypothetical protein LOC62_01G000690 [Vanrija pseudolonga]WOO77101.1 hypothetical protein LOC62_01G000690 [Vanrija pseudolonga]WOO77102.1 hypothetical protein LOC62_01G000690 [Vanrija pseudolonga]WOO77103.1 hypothetical protein LOC62_01G000690 [Vanrija pseudolonga]
MEPNWGLYNNYYSSGGGERPPPPVSPHLDRSDDQPPHRRSMNQGVFLPPPPPQQGQSGLLPPVSASYGSSYHGSSPSGVGLSQSGAGTGNSSAPMHMTPPSMGYSSHVPMSSQLGPYHYPVQNSPATMSALPPGRQTQPHGYSPRIAGGYPTASPGMSTLSPLSPSNHMAYQVSSGSTSASSFPPSVPPPHTKVELPSMQESKKRRTNSGSTTSWDDMGHKDDEEQPWGMPQDQYKALNPRDKKQVRNRIGARRFRAKRKDYVSALEYSKKEADAKIVQLEGQLESSRREINDLRARLNMAPLPPPVDGSLGLVVGSGE